MFLCDIMVKSKYKRGIKLKNVLQYLEKVSIKNREKIAIIEEDKKVKYKELIEESKRIGSYLCNYEIFRRPIGVYMEKGINAIYSFFGTICF